MELSLSIHQRELSLCPMEQVRQRQYTKHTHIINEIHILKKFKDEHILCVVIGASYVCKKSKYEIIEKYKILISNK